MKAKFERFKKIVDAMIAAIAYRLKQKKTDLYFSHLFLWV